MKILSTHYQPFQVASVPAEDGFDIYVNKGNVHGFFKPERLVEVSGASVELINGEAEKFHLTEEENILFVRVVREVEQYGIIVDEEGRVRGNQVGVPRSAFIEVDSEIPEVEDDFPMETFYEICRLEDSIIKQGICSDIWDGYVIRQVLAFRSSSSSSSSSSSESP